jgi:nucleotide-binding universal stress UspA family protein
MLNPGSKDPSIQNIGISGQETGALVTERVGVIFEHSMERIDERTIQDLAHLLTPLSCEITLIHVLPEPWSGIFLKRDDPALLNKYVEEREQTQEDVKTELNALIRQKGFNLAEEQVYNLKDSNIPSLIEQMNQSQQDLVVLCGNHFSSSAVLRSHMFTHLAAHLSSSVLLLKKHLFGSRKAPKILIGIDDTEASMLAVRKIGSLVRAQDADITLATVQSPIYQENAVLAPFVNQDVLNEALKANTNMLFEMTTDLLQAEGIQVQECRTMIGSPATELGYLAELDNPDLIVVGSHNRKGIIAWVMGSVSSQLLQWDNHNLLIVR